MARFKRATGANYHRTPGMKNSDRYSTSHLPESQFEPGSDDQVLKKKLDITTPDEMDRREKEEQLRAMDELTDLFDSNHRFTTADICRMHNVWLGNIYEWAGKYRQVKMHKADFSFAYPEQIPKLMDEFEKGLLREFSPCHFKSHQDIARALAVVHTELVLIHPFREGNGRVSRMPHIEGTSSWLAAARFSGHDHKGQRRIYPGDSDWRWWKLCSDGKGVWGCYS